MDKIVEKNNHLLLTPKEYKLIQDLKTKDKDSLYIWIEYLIKELKLESSSEKKERLDRLKTIALQFGNRPAVKVLTEFLHQLKMLQTPDEYQPGINKVTLSTLHAAKGLEFSVVFIIGLEEGLLPYQKSLEDASQLEEERRLLYVGITRAKQFLYLTNTKKRKTHSQWETTKPSRFLKQLESSMLEEVEDQLANKYLKHKEIKRRKKLQMKLF